MTITVNNVYKSFGKPAIDVLHDISFTINSGEFVSLTGKSGSGKSTLLYIISSLDNPSRGNVSIDNQNLAQLNENTIHQFRNQQMGFVFQFHYLLPELTALENVLMPTRKTNEHLSKHADAIELLQRFDLDKKAHKFPNQLSGGEQQRVSIARALINKPRYLFADEPTGNLDSHNGQLVMQIFREINQQGTTIVMVTHDADFAALAHRQITLADGTVVSAPNRHHSVLTPA